MDNLIKFCLKENNMIKALNLPSPPTTIKEIYKQKH